MIRSAADVAELGTILGIWAHPDDEAYLSGGVMAIARDLGSRVVCVTATRGELGTSDPVTWPPERLAEERTVELTRSLQILGVTEHHWLGYRDGQCANMDPQQAVSLLCDMLDRVRPDTVLSFGPDGFTGHPDHQTVGRWAAAAIGRAGLPGTQLLQAAVDDRHADRWADLNDELGVYYPGFPVTVPGDRLVVDLSLKPDVRARKVRALVAQHTQTAGLMAALGVEKYTSWVGEESFAVPPPRDETFTTA